MSRKLNTPMALRNQAQRYQACHTRCSSVAKAMYRMRHAVPAPTLLLPHTLRRHCAPFACRRPLCSAASTHPPPHLVLRTLPAVVPHTTHAKHFLYLTLPALCAICWPVPPPASSLNHPLSALLCHAEQVYSGEHLVFETSQVSLDIPYGEPRSMHAALPKQPNPNPKQPEARHACMVYVPCLWSLQSV